MNRESFVSWQASNVYDSQERSKECRFIFFAVFFFGTLSWKFLFRERGNNMYFVTGWNHSTKLAIKKKIEWKLTRMLLDKDDDDDDSRDDWWESLICDITRDLCFSLSPSVERSSLNSTKRYFVIGYDVLSIYPTFIYISIYVRTFICASWLLYIFFPRSSALTKSQWL